MTLGRAGKSLSSFMPKPNQLSAKDENASSAINSEANAMMAMFQIRFTGATFACFHTNVN